MSRKDNKAPLGERGVKDNISLKNKTLILKKKTLTQRIIVNVNKVQNH